MTAENFCYWLQGLFEIQKPKEITHRQVREIKNHLRLVLGKPQLTGPIFIPLSDITSQPIFSSDRDYVYITITKDPLWKNREYCGYNDEKKLIEEINKILNISLKKEKTKIIVDKVLNPKISEWCNNLKVTDEEANQLTGLPTKDIPGIVNIGTGEPRCC